MNGEGNEDIMRNAEPVSAEEQTSLVNGGAMGGLTSKPPSPNEEQTSEPTTDQHKEMQVEDTAGSSAAQSVAPAAQVVYYHSDKESWVRTTTSGALTIDRSKREAWGRFAKECFASERQSNGRNDCAILYNFKGMPGGVALNVTEINEDFKTIDPRINKASIEEEEAVGRRVRLASLLDKSVIAISRAEVVIAISRADSKTRLVGHGSALQFYETAREPWKHCAYHENIERQTNRKPLQFLERNDDDDASLTPSQLWQPP
jgi:hypothetical protein